MRFFLIGDAHGNLEALNSVFADMRKNYSPSFMKKKDNKSDILANLGDLIGYMPNPNEVVNKTLAVSDINLPGNHDIAVIDRSAFDFNEVAEWAINWTDKTISPKVRKELNRICANPGRVFSVNSSVFAHSTPHRPEDMNYIESRFDAVYGFFDHEKFKGLTAFVGHRHIPQLYFMPKGKSEMSDVSGEVIEFDRIFSRQVKQLDLSTYESSLVVIPSVGQPRDGNPLSGYAVYDSLSKKLDMVRIPYDIAAVQAKMKKLDFPVRLIQRLDFGR